jgi:hypothetical protein
MAAFTSLNNKLLSDPDSLASYPIFWFVYGHWTDRKAVVRENRTYTNDNINHI